MIISNFQYMPDYTFINLPTLVVSDPNSSEFKQAEEFEFQFLNQDCNVFLF